MAKSSASLAEQRPIQKGAVRAGAPQPLRGTPQALAPASMLDRVPFGLSLLDTKPDDVWVVVSLDRVFESAGDPTQGAVSAADLDLLEQGAAAHLFPFMFHSRYLRLAELDSNLDLDGPIAEQVLFRLIQAGAKIIPSRRAGTAGRTRPLPAAMRSEVELVKHFHFAFSARLPGVANDRPPTRFSYKTFMWISDDGCTLHKVYRHPDGQPQLHPERNPALSGGLSHVVRYHRVTHYRSPTGSRHLGLVMDCIADAETLSDRRQSGLSLELRRAAVDAFSNTWLAFLDCGLVPSDLSMSNVLLRPGNRDPVLIDMERSVDIEQVVANGAKRSLLCVLALAHDLARHPGPTLGRFDAHRDDEFAARFQFDAGRCRIDRGGEPLPYDLFEAVMNADNAAELRRRSEELWQYASSSL